MEEAQLQEGPRRLARREPSLCQQPALKRLMEDTVSLGASALAHQPPNRGAGQDVSAPHRQGRRALRRVLCIWRAPSCC